MITIINYNMGNLGSITNMIKKVGGTSRITSSKEEILNSDKILLPGVGSFDQAMKNLEELGLVEPIIEVAKRGIPLLGICLGMQLLAESSDEGVKPGLGLIKGKVKKFEEKFDLKIPHMGWNQVKYNEACRLWMDFSQFEETRFYFVHSFYFKCEFDSNIAGTTHYGLDFTSAVSNENVMGVQFHPEKSHKFGMKMMQNFIEY